MQGKIVLITGGARSGKSLFAEQYAAAQTDKVAYIATAQVYDQEMQTRVTLHRQRRPDTWQTFEAPYDADQILQEAAKQANVILFDCLTLYTSNLLLSPNTPTNPEETYQYIMKQIEKLVISSRASQATVLFVTNEVGMGIVPDNALARQYRDIAGMVNQKMAAHADEVYLVISGLPVEIKKIATQIAKGVHHG
ncbi:bifunctional adenosylcobinamide kinase/adenosylcobinamide-phosphate guanylyltransferase [Pelosinus sp. IPA-1]|uniref:bifunctional adenosylcobinamide kinase/adenosylcobinamide-phosphate guanylyltransferase n=1 Tax=Pelosinus sp. IPA-1 TaxID=3029569 RepID=UPI002436294C|nr:bifunctional adenosylcobinamide kinase/adenosylcobinamide-phosphate guanylyltransferase [Pelosinus sp. IPA-1]GMA99415.1 adenosylcobinamide kinase/adenosylcobinamide phosphate guanyltransferase [Pelosinus sp. IPA-1]